MLLEGVLLFILLWLYARKHRYRGQVAGLFLLGYAVFRFVAEFWREPDAHLGILGLGLSMGQWLSLPMMLIGAVVWLWATRVKVDDRDAAVDNPEDNFGAASGVLDEPEPAVEAEDTPSQRANDTSTQPREP